MTTSKPINQMTPAEKAALVVRMKAAGIYDDDFVGFLGNLNHLLWAVPERQARSRKPASRKRTKVTA
ncbi:MAG: hypothetical protein QE570_07190 [Verrucomicrobiota bacterium]|jgi:hypothetical protein|nr:hypothetical protein [Verrucomicrobiota bacterium]